MAECIAPVLVVTGLRGGHEKGAVFNGPRPMQHHPMGLSGLFGKTGRCREKMAARLRQIMIKMGKTHIITDRNAQAAPWQINRHRFRPCGIGA